jgi:hypothetical protein
LVSVESDKDEDEHIQQKMSQMSVKTAEAKIALKPKNAVEVQTDEDRKTIEEDTQTAEALLLYKITNAPLIPGPFHEPRKRQEKIVR